MMMSCGDGGEEIRAGLHINTIMTGLLPNVDIIHDVQWTLCLTNTSQGILHGKTFHERHYIMDFLITSGSKKLID